MANGQRNIADGLDDDEIESWVADYCHENLLETVGDAMIAFIWTFEAK